MHASRCSWRGITQACVHLGCINCIQCHCCGTIYSYCCRQQHQDLESCKLWMGIQHVSTNRNIPLVSWFYINITYCCCLLECVAIVEPGYMFFFPLSLQVSAQLATTYSLRHNAEVGSGHTRLAKVAMTSIVSIHAWRNILITHRNTHMEHVCTVHQYIHHHQSGACWARPMKLWIGSGLYTTAVQPQ